jgi:hypothetical protein
VGAEECARVHVQERGSDVLECPTASECVGRRDIIFRWRMKVCGGSDGSDCG